MVLYGNQNSEHFSGKLTFFWGGGLAPVSPWAPKVTSVAQTPFDLLPPWTNS